MADKITIKIEVFPTQLKGTSNVAEDTRTVDNTAESIGAYVQEAMQSMQDRLDWEPKLYTLKLSFPGE